MKKTKLTELLSSFSTAEIKRFNSFLNSPYFNDKPRFVKLFDALSKFHPNYENENLTEEKVFAETFPGKTYSYTIFKNSLSDLYDLAKQFVACEEMNSDRLQSKNMFLRNIFHRDNIKGLVDKELNIAEQFFGNEITEQAYFEQYYSFKKNKEIKKSEPTAVKYIWKDMPSYDRYGNEITPRARENMMENSLNQKKDNKETNNDITEGKRVK